MQWDGICGLRSAPGDVWQQVGLTVGLAIVVQSGAGDTCKCTVSHLRPSEGEGVSFSEAAGAVVS